jgi:tripartite-type tricarboxylate transporter receptor subunit TctC
MTARAVACLVAVMATAPALADPVADFYRGKTITLTVGLGAGGGYDIYARTIARHMPRFIPGEPQMVVKNNPGAGGLVLANQLYNVAARDGTEIGTFNRTLVLDPLFGNDKAQYDVLRFTWLGSPASEVSTCVAYHTAGVRTVAELRDREVVTGAPGTTTDAAIYPRVSNALLGTRFRIVSGYTGGAAAILAMERGETNGFCGWAWSSMQAQRPGWFQDKRIHVLLQYGLTRNPQFGDVPLAVELTRTPRERQMFEIVVAPQLFARPFMAPPGLPAERARALRTAFEATIADADFRKEAADRQLDVELVTGDQVLDVLKRIYASPRDMVEDVKALLK